MRRADLANLLGVCGLVLATVLAVLLTGGAAWADQGELATTESGAKVRLHKDGTWVPVADGPWAARIAAGTGGADVAAVCDASGVWAWAPGFRLDISDVAASWCLADPWAEVIWLAREGLLQLIDLRTAGGPVTVATGWPGAQSGTAWEARPARIVYAPGRGISNASHNDVFNIALRPATAKVDVEVGNFYYEFEDAELAAFGKKVKVTDRKLLADLAKRATAAAAPKAAPPSPCPKSVAGVPAAACESGGCGAAEPIGATPYCRVMVSQSCGDGCYIEYAFWDTNAKAYLFGYTPGGEGSTIPFSGSAALHIAPGGRHVIAGGVLSDWKSALVKTGASGWLRPGALLPGE